MNAYAVVVDTHYECGDAVGIALTLGGAQDIAQKDSDRRLAAMDSDPVALAWASGADGPGPSWWGGHNCGFSFSYTITRWEVET